MLEADRALEQEVWGLFQPMQTASLATVEADLPRARPVTLVHHDDKLWVATGTTSNKVKQLLLNPNVEFHFLVGARESPGYVRGYAKAEIVEDRHVRANAASAMPFFSTFWNSSNDPDFTLLRLHVRELEYMKPGTFDVRRFSVC